MSRREAKPLRCAGSIWTIRWVYATGSTPNQPLVDKTATRLEQSQQADGRWSSEDSSSQDVHVTLEAMRALWLCERVVK